ncbi:MAG: hypothetical protein IKE24_01145 [Clostridia bacterium]|nr:hypothetical protein [Clostridia bacterium]
MTMIAIGMVLAFLLYIFKNYWWLMLKIRQYGVETDATVCRIEKGKQVAYGSATEYPRTFYYVVYQGRDGLPTEARLLNPKTPLNRGDGVRIKYLEEKNGCAVLIQNSVNS